MASEAVGPGASGRNPAGHDPERAAAAYLGGGQTAVEREAFSAHLLDCDPCWHELHAAEQGRRSVESARVVAPVELRERLRATVSAEIQEDAAVWATASVLASATGAGPVPVPGSGPVQRAGPRRWLLVAAGVLATLVLAGSSWVAVRPGDGLGAEPRALVEAVADFRAQALPGRMLPTERAPDLSMLSLSTVGAAGGDYEGLAVDGYAYRDGAGRRLVVYLSKEPFPTAAGARQLAGADGPWTAERGDIVMLCARAPHALLVVGQDAQLVQGVADQLGVL